ncbi:MAG: hypothetical protein HXX13_09980 [Bacteroidetes bacterium]|nr:hypothetical protein [Bacteroidota bacterium]
MKPIIDVKPTSQKLKELLQKHDKQKAEHALIQYNHYERTRCIPGIKA